MSALEAHLVRQIERSRDFFWHRLRWRVVLEHLPRDYPFRVLDIGAGAGLLGEFLRRDLPQASYRFVELLEPLERYLEARYGAAANAKGEPNYAGVEHVTLLDVLEHQADDRLFMEELVGKMEPGATLFVTVPALSALWSQWDVALGHHRRYDKAAMRRCVEGLPLEVDELSYLFPELVPAALMRRLTRRASKRTPSDEASFPDLPKVVNAILYAVGAASLRIRRGVPFGTSLFGVFRRT